MVILLLACGTEAPVGAPEPGVELVPIVEPEPERIVTPADPFMIFAVEQWHTDGEAERAVGDALATQVTALQEVVLSQCASCAVVRERTRYTAWPAGLHGLTEFRVTLPDVTPAPGLLRALELKGARLQRARLPY